MIPLTPTSAFLSPLLPPRSMPRWLNRFSYRLVAELLWRAFRKATNAARLKVGLPPGRNIWSGHPMLYRDLADPASATGRLAGQRLDVRTVGAPGTRVGCPCIAASFLSAGDAPVYVGFGSMVGFDQRALLDVVIAAGGGQRALFNPGWSGVDSVSLPPTFCVIGDTHDWLFFRTSLIIPHGGSGTTHSAARAGVPSVVLPFAPYIPNASSSLKEPRPASEAVDPRALPDSRVRPDGLPEARPRPP
jgi:sterol 3beta-glucosyltransferase